jgi:hypothetical protein
LVKQQHIKVIKGFRLNITLQKQTRHHDALAKDHMERLYKRKTYKMIYTFSKMKDKKLESLRKVKAFYA